MQSGTSAFSCFHIPERYPAGQLKLLYLNRSTEEGDFSFADETDYFPASAAADFPYLFGIDGVMYTAPIADLAAASVSIVMVVREFKIMAELQKAAA